MAESAKDLLGDAYPRLLESRERGRRHRSKQKEPHRLVELIQAAEEAYEQLQGPSPSVRGFELLELSAVLGLVEFWRNDPAWPEIVRSLRSPTHFRHETINLAAAKFLSYANPNPTLHPPGDDHRKRRGDIYLANGPTVVEVKAPKALQITQPRRQALSSRDARRIVAKCLSSSGTSEASQLGGAAGGLLIIGGFYLRDAYRGLLAQAADDLLAASPPRPHCLGIGIISLGVVLQTDSVVEPKGILRSRDGGPTTLSPVLEVSLSKNPQYSGGVALVTDVELPQRVDVGPEFEMP